MVDFLLKNGDAWAGEMAQGVKTFPVDSHNPHGRREPTTVMRVPVPPLHTQNK